MNERPILTPTLQGFCRTAMETISDEFAARYPGARCIVGSELHAGKFRFTVSHHSACQHAELSCHIGTGGTPEEAFAHLDSQLGPPMSEAERLRRKAEQLMRDAAELEARMVSADLQPSNQLPAASSPSV